MEKKYACILAAVLLFFGGAIWVSEAPVWASLVACLEVVGGFFCGFFFNKFQNEVKMGAANEEIEGLKAEIASMKEATKKVKASAQKGKE